MSAIIPSGIIRSTEDLGDLVRKRRKTLALTQADAAMLCGVGTRFLSELERGKPTAHLGKTLQILAGLGLELQLHGREQKKATVAPDQARDGKQ